ncbi:MAG: hypothetical protein AAFW60_07705 [Pseudomonadota bacterium]
MIAIILTSVLLLAAFSAFVYAARRAGKTAANTIRVLSGLSGRLVGSSLLFASFLPVISAFGLEIGIPVWLGLATVCAVGVLWIGVRRNLFMVMLGIFPVASSALCSGAAFAC